MSCVLQEWVTELTMMQQSVLITGVRGPDGITKYSPVKMLLRWYRRCIMFSAIDGVVLENPVMAGGGSFTGPSYTIRPEDEIVAWPVTMNQIVGEVLSDVDSLPHHFVMHLIHAAEIIGYKHPDDRIRDWWREDVYFRFVKSLHLQPETEEQLDERLGDTRDGWVKHGDTATEA